MTTLGAAASQKFEKDVKDLLQRELKVAEREATLAVMMAMQATKNSLFKGIFFRSYPRAHVLWDIKYHPTMR